MELLGYEFLGQVLDARRNADGLIATYVHDNPEGRLLNPYGGGPFVRIVLSSPLDSLPGVYAVTVDGDLMYLGRARTTLRDRWGSNGYANITRYNTYRNGQNTNCRINREIGHAMIAGSIVELWTHVTESPTEVEAELERAYRPDWNIQRL